MLPLHLTNSEIKNAAGTEVEFTGSGPVGRTREFIQVNENPSQKHRFKIQHQESGVGLKAVRRSNIRGDKIVISGVDSLTPLPIVASLTVQVPIGGLISLTEVKNLLAEMMSLLSATVANDGLLHLDCTGYGADALVNGTA